MGTCVNLGSQRSSSGQFLNFQENCQVRVSDAPWTLCLYGVQGRENQSQFLESCCSETILPDM